MKDIVRFIAGFERFQEKYFAEERELFEQLVCGQSPKALIVACADSHVDPALLTGAEPGDVFVVRNATNLVPPYAPGGSFASLHGWYFDLAAGALLHYDLARNAFEGTRSSQQPVSGVSS